MGGSSGRYFWFKRLFGALAVVGFIWVLLVGGNLEGGGNKDTTALTSQSTGNLNGGMESLGGTEKYLNRPELDLNSMSKRRVPNGPDPIHNRRAGNTKRPPGQS